MAKAKLLFLDYAKLGYPGPTQSFATLGLLLAWLAGEGTNEITVKSYAGLSYARLLLAWLAGSAKNKITVSILR